MSQDRWNPEQYNRFQAEREAPFHDLAALVERKAGMRVVDLGCGDGRLTSHLHLELAAASTTGVDSSAAMLAKAPTDRAGLSFENANIAEFLDKDSEPYDLIFSNAALQWLPDHKELWKKLANRLSPTGQLAVQMPANHEHPYHEAARQVASFSPFREALSGYSRVTPVLTLKQYSLLLHRLGFVRQNVSMQIYLHLLEERDSLVEWARGTLLTDYEKRMPAQLFPQFVDRYREVIGETFADEKPFALPFERILLWGSRA